MGTMCKRSNYTQNAPQYEGDCEYRISSINIGIFLQMAGHMAGHIFSNTLYQDLLSAHVTMNLELFDAYNSVIDFDCGAEVTTIYPVQGGFLGMSWQQQCETHQSQLVMFYTEQIVSIIARDSSACTSRWVTCRAVTVICVSQ